MSDKVFTSVWDAIEDSPAMAANMKLRSSLMMAITERIRAMGLTQAEAAKLFAVSQPRISDLMRGKIGLFSLDVLVGMLSAAGVTVDVKLRQPGHRPGLPGQREQAKVQHDAAPVKSKTTRRRVAA